jgi:hypothetical protein
MKRKLFLLFFILCLTQAYSQTYQFKGKVIDQNTKKALPFVAISILGDTRGLQTDIDGKFSLNANKNTLNLRMHYVGYESKEVLITSNEELVIELKSKENLIKEVLVVAGENPANKIIRKVYNNKDKNNPEKLQSFRYMSYNKFVFTGKEDTALFSRIYNEGVKRLDSTDAKYQFKKDSIKAKVEKMKFSGDSLFGKQHVFLTETVTQRDFMFPEKNKEQIKAVKISGLKNPMFVLIASQFQSFSFYKDYMVVLDKNYLSPISKGSTSKYFFNLEDTLIQNNDSVFVISFKPLKDKNFDGMKGVLYINKDGYAVQNVIAEPVKSSTFRIKIQQQYEKVQNMWFPTQLNTDIELDMVSINTRKMVGSGRTYIKDIQIGIEQEKKKFDGVVIDYDQKSIKNYSDSLLSKYRIDTLDKKEKQTYYILDSIGTAEKLDEKIKLFDILSKGYIPWGYVQFDIKRLLSAYNDYEGVRLGLGIGTSEKFSKYFSLDVYGAWGTKDHKFKYGSILKVPIYLKQDIELQASVYKDVIESGSVNFRGDRKTKFDSYRNLLVWNMDWQEGIDLQLSVRSQHYLLHYLYATQNKRTVTNTYLFSDNGLLINNFETREFGLTTRWAYGENFIRQSKQRISIGTKYPIVWFNVAYAEGVNSTWQGNYWKFDTKIKKSFTIRNAGTLHVQAFAGAIKGNVPYPFAYNGRANYNGKFSLATQAYFETMRMNEFLSSEYVALFMQHDFGKLLYQRKHFKPGVSLSTAYGIGSLSNTVQHVGINYKTMEKGYAESGVLLSDLFVLKTNLYNMGLGLGVFYRYGAYRNVSEKDNLAYKLNFSISF